MNGFTITTAQANALVDKLCEIIARRENAIYERVEKDEKNKTKKVG